MSCCQIMKQITNHSKIQRFFVTFIYNFTFTTVLPQAIAARMLMYGISTPIRTYIHTYTHTSLRGIREACTVHLHLNVIIICIKHHFTSFIYFTI